MTPSQKRAKRLAMEPERVLWCSHRVGARCTRRALYVSAADQYVVYCGEHRILADVPIPYTEAEAA